MFSANINGQDFQLSVIGKKLSPEKVFEMLTDKVMGEGRAKAIQLSNVDAGIKSLFDGLTDKTQVNNMIVASLSLKETQIELANRFGLTIDAAGKVSVASGKAGDDLAKFATSIAAAGLSSRTVGTQIIKSSQALFDDFNKVFGDVVTEAVLSTVSRQVEVPGTLQPVNRSFGLGGNNNSNNGLLGFPQQNAVVKQYVTVTEQITQQISRIVSSNLSLPRTLADYDTLLKNIDKTAAAGQKMFADVFALRDQFITFTSAVDGLKGNVRGALFGIVSDAEKQKFLNQDLAKIFGKLKIAVPGSVQELINLGNSIDYTTVSGLDLAAAFPSLVSAFKTTQEGVESLINSLRDESGFKTLYDFNFYKGIAGNYGNEFANRFTDGAAVTYGASNNTSASLPLNIAANNNTTISTSDPNMLNAVNTLTATVNALKAEIIAIKTNTKSSADTLLRVSPDGDSIQTKVAV